MTAQRIEAAKPTKPKGSAEGESLVRQDAPNSLAQKDISMTDTTEQQAVPVAQEWVTVPREPTDAMVNACQDSLYSQNPSWNDPREIWSAMLATAPALPCKSGEGAVSVNEAIRIARIEADKVYGIAWHQLEEISRVELILNALDRPKPDATQTREAEAEEAAHLRTIDERDALHEALSDAYRAVCGREPQWSNLFGLNDAVDDMREAAGEPEKDLLAALKPFADCAEQIDPNESDEEWAKFRLLIGDYRRARAALNARGGA